MSQDDLRSMGESSKRAVRPQGPRSNGSPARHRRAVNERPGRPASSRARSGQLRTEPTRTTSDRFSGQLGSNRSSRREQPKSLSQIILGSPRPPQPGSTKRRLRAVTLGWAVIFALMAFQVVRLQVNTPDTLLAAGRNQRLRSATISAERGDFTDRFGVPLAISVREWRLIGNPAAVTDLTSESKKVAEIVGGALTEDWVRQRLQRSSRYVVIARGINDETAKKIRASKVPSVTLEEEPRRIYPAGDLARSTLGRVNRVSGVGETGLEMLYQDNMQGRDGTANFERGTGGNRIPSANESLIPARRGTSFQLTLDRSLQYAVEGMTAQAVADSGAKFGIAVVADVASGDILALANLEVDDEGNVINSGRNAAFVDLFEPGSTSKVIPIAGALEQGLYQPDTKINVPDRLMVADHRFKDDTPHPEKMWTVTDIVAQSSNIGVIKISKSLGSEALDRYLRAFGYGRSSETEFPRETAGILAPLSKWNGTTRSSVAIGQGVSTTAVQMLQVYNTLANGGVRIPLRLVRGSTDASGKFRSVRQDKGVRVVSEKTAGEVTAMLESVVRGGTGTKAQVEGYRIAGKTGTAQKAIAGRRGYSDTAYVASFAGYFPAEKPKLSIVVILDEPSSSIYGGVVAAPLFAEVARFAGQRYVIPPSDGQTQVFTKRPSVALTDAVSTAEMREVAKTGTWQGAVIRRSAVPTRTANGSPKSKNVADGSSRTADATAAETAVVDSAGASIDPTAAAPVAQTTEGSTPSTSGAALPDLSRSTKKVSVKVKAKSVTATTVPAPIIQEEVAPEPAKPRTPTIPDLSTTGGQQVRPKAVVAPELLASEAAPAGSRGADPNREESSANASATPSAVAAASGNASTDGAVVRTAAARPAETVVE